MLGPGAGNKKGHTLPLLQSVARLFFSHSY